MTDQHPLFVTADRPLLEDLQRLAAAAGVTPEVAAHPESARPRWRSASLVLVGCDAAPAVAGLGLMRRMGVHLVGAGPPAGAAFEMAVHVGAESVLALPRDEATLVDLMSDAADGRGSGLLVGVVGGSGGVGASVLTAALAQVAARAGPALAIDLDPHGAGLDRILGLDEVAGIRWEQLADSAGRLAGRSLREAVPGDGAMAVLAFEDDSAPTMPDRAVVAEVIGAALRGFPSVLADLGRDPDPDVVGRCHRVVLMTTATMCGIASARRTLQRLDGVVAVPPWVVLRSHGSVGAETVAELLGAAVAAEIPERRRLGEALDVGLPPVRRRSDRLARACSGLWAAVRSEAA